LLLLQMLRQTVSWAATAREITIATEGNADSLYVLLGRWATWGLVHWRGTEPYSYMIAPEGERYLSKIDNWFFKGYYSRKHKRRVPGYKGKVEDLKREIAIASKAVFWFRFMVGNHWARDREREQCEREGRISTKGVVYCFMAPFKTRGDFVKQEGSEGRGILWGRDNLLVVRFEDGHQAYSFLPKWGFKQSSRDDPKGLGQALVDANVGVVWKTD